MVARTVLDTLRQVHSQAQPDIATVFEVVARLGQDVGESHNLHASHSGKYLKQCLLDCRF